MMIKQLFKISMGRIAALQALLLLSILLPGAFVVAQVATPELITQDDLVSENAEVAAALKELLASMEDTQFSYQTEGRADPFKPFISKEVAQEAVETTPEELTGMRQFEPGQLSLVAIIFTEENPMAMVEDSSHKGYIVRKGTKIGRSGIISDIEPNMVIIKQLSYSMSREKKYNTVEMTLRKEGEK